MLVLSRKTDESIVIGTKDGKQRQAVVTVLEIRGPHVKLGIEAAHEIPVHRSEVWAKIHRPETAVA